jgi:hypothetical protein
MHGSSYLSSLPDEILEVMHLRKHMSVREWIAAFGQSLTFYVIVGLGEMENWVKGIGAVLCWIVLFWVSFLMNCWSSCLSRSGRFDTSGMLISIVKICV